MTYYKATRTDGTSFHDSTTKWKVGRITRHPNPDTSKGLCSDGVLHISDAPGETLVGGSWPCRLFEVEPRSALISGDEHKHGCTAVKVVRELPAWQALGPNGEAVAAHIEQCKVITLEQARQLNAAGFAARDAALALVVRDLITPEQFDRLYGPWASVMGPSRTEPENQ